MADFPDFDPAPGMTKSSSPTTRKVQFGDGYEARLSYGLQQNPKTFNFTFNVSESESDTIETFLDARAADADNFTYTPPGEASALKFVCEQWSKSIPSPDRATINATFRQVFEP
tara:strand:+ start:795 stop:1136 length:342 start_codon:yes stop_codon:yes gene_type:complete